MKDEFAQALVQNQALFGLDLNAPSVALLTDYFELVMEHNPLLHLVAPCSPAEFAVRHVLESLAMLEFLPAGARFADVGTGAGLPSIPCLILRDDLTGFLVESKAKKADFLRGVIDRFGLGGRASVINKQFAETPRSEVSFVCSRALDRFVQHLPKLTKWSGENTLLFFGGPALRDAMSRQGLNVREKLMPMSEQRYLFVANR